MEPCEELCIVRDYEDDWSSHAAFADCAEGFKDENRSVESRPTSYTPTQVSELSLQCRGDKIIRNRSTSFSFDFEQSPNNFEDEGFDTSGENENGPYAYALEGWVDKRRQSI